MDHQIERAQTTTSSGRFYVKAAPSVVVVDDGLLNVGVSCGCQAPCSWKLSGWGLLLHSAAPQGNRVDTLTDGLNRHSNCCPVFSNRS
jgi:hypothetical protein